MNYIEKTLLRFLRGNKIKIELVGFDMNGFTEALRCEWKQRLDLVEGVVFEDESDFRDEEKITILKGFFEHDFCDED